MGTLLPQAYTKETLAQAFLWLKEQPEEVARLATTSDRLVALYLRARKGGFPMGVSTPPAVAQPPTPPATFEAELKQMASEYSEQSSLQKNASRSALANPESLQPQPIVSAPPPEIRQTLTPPSPMKIEAATADPVVPHSLVSIEWLGPELVEMVNEIKQRFHTQSDADTVRMLVTLGYEQVERAFGIGEIKS